LLSYCNQNIRSAFAYRAFPQQETIKLKNKNIIAVKLSRRQSFGGVKATNDSVKEAMDSEKCRKPSIWCVFTALSAGVSGAHGVCQCWDQLQLG